MVFFTAQIHDKEINEFQYSLVQEPYILTEIFAKA